MIDTNITKFEVLHGLTCYHATMDISGFMICYGLFDCR